MQLRTPSPQFLAGGRRLVAVMLGALAAVLLSAGPVAAHPSVLATDPPAGYTIDAPPVEVSLTFSEPVDPTRLGLVVRDAEGAEVETGPIQELAEGRTQAVTPISELSPGLYTVTWQVVAQDGDVVTGDFSFGVAPPPGSAAGAVSFDVPQPSDADAVQTSGLASGTALRWLLFTGLALALGGLAGERLAQRIGEGTTTRAPVASGGLLMAAAALGLALHHVGGGDVLAGLGELSSETLTATRAGLIDSVELGSGLLVAVLGAWRRTRPLALAPLLAVLAAEGARSHIGPEAPVLGPVVVAVHLVAAAVWVGALIHVVRVGLAQRRTPTALLRGYARIAAWLFAAVVLSGTVASVILLGSPRDLVDTGYGQVLLVKLGLVALAAALALAGRRQLSQPRPAGRWVSTVGAGEGTALVAVLALAALLISVPPPVTATASSAQPLALPPPPITGPALRLGTLAGQVTVEVTASSGQLEVRTSVPGNNPEAKATFSVTASTTAPTGTRTVPLRPCGDSCFVGPASWSEGQNQLHLDVKADGWAGGEVRFDVPWPPVPVPEELRAALAAMAAVPEFELTEAVTSDTSVDSTYAQTLTLTGPRFLATEPYNGTAADSAMLLSAPGEVTTIALAVPADGFYIRLELAPDGRFLREVLTTPNHLIDRTFRYP